MTDKASIKGMNKNNGKNKAVLVYIAKIPNKTPKVMDPVSPMKNLAGLILNHRKAKTPPITTAKRDAKSNLPSKKAIAIYGIKAIKEIPPAKPSNPSVSFKAKAVPTITKIKNGIYQKPRWTVPTKGTYNMSHSSFT
jgi:hypothetical protein